MVKSSFSEEATMLVPSPDTQKHDLARAIGIDYLAILSCGETFGLPVLAISEILRVPRITRVPRAPIAVAGIATVRGAVITLFDLPRLIHLSGATTIAATNRILIVDRPQEKLGILVEAVTEVFRVEKEMLEPPQVIGGEPAPHVLAVARPKGSPIVLLNEHLLFEGIS